MGLVQQLVRDEGFRPHPYRDTVGKLTIGIGRNLDDVGISLDEAQFMLANDIAVARLALQKALPWTAQLDSVRRDVLLNMTFNMGINSLLRFKDTLGYVQTGRYREAAASMLDSQWAMQVGPRAQRLAKQMQDGEQQPV